jgi:Mitochondrial carrier protein
MADLWIWLRRAGKSAFQGGSAGALAMILQVVLLMWLRTIINYQYRYGGTVLEVMHILYAEGGIGRFYQGATYALLQGPLSRFGDTAANEGMKELLSGGRFSVGFITACASMTAAIWRIFLTPIDTIKTTLQVSGSEGMERLWSTKVSKYGLGVLYDGALGNWGANIVGHYPWFVVNNQLEATIPVATTPRNKLIRRAFIGFCSSVVSDCCSNGIRVIKTYKQTSDLPLSYLEAIRQLLEKSGLVGLLFRGLGMKLVSNALSSILFSVLWKMIMERLQQTSNKGSSSSSSSSATAVDDKHTPKKSK